MKRIIYFFEFIVIKLFFTICKILGYRFSSDLGFYIGKTVGNIFRKKTSIIGNLKNLKFQLIFQKTNLQKMY